MGGQRTIAGRRAKLNTVSSAVWLRAFVAAVCLIIVVLEGWQYWSGRNEAIAGTKRVMADLAHSLIQHAEDTFELADAVLVDLVDRVELRGASPDAIMELEDALTQRIQTLPRFKSLMIFGEDGFLLSASLPGHRTRVNVRDYAFFQHHSTSSDRKWLFGPLISDPLGEGRVLTLSRRFNKPDGSFGGAVAITIAPLYFSNFYAQFNVGSKGTIVLFGTDGTLLSRYPYQESLVGRESSSMPLFREYLRRSTFGSYSFVSQIDGVTRIAGYRSSHIFPIVVSSALGEDDALASWNRETVIRAAAVAVLIAVIAFLGWGLAGQLRRREKAEAELAILAATDGLTGLANRRTFDNVLKSEWRRALRTGTQLSLLMLDIDHFKSFNDTYGHQAGDKCLRAVAQVLADTVGRSGDLAARYGGEELVVLLPGTDMPGASAVAEKIRLQVEALAMPVSPGTGAPRKALTISIGSATLRPADEPSWPVPAKLVALADRALYRAKLAGRNRIAVYEAA